MQFGFSVKKYLNHNFCDFFLVRERLKLIFSQQKYLGINVFQITREKKMER